MISPLVAWPPTSWKAWVAALIFLVRLSDSTQSRYSDYLPPPPFLFFFFWMCACQ